MRTDNQRQKHAAYMRSWKIKNPDKAEALRERFKLKNPNYSKIHAKQWRKNNPDKVALQKRRHQIRKYGITPEKYRDMNEKQKSKCAICATTATRDLDIDHCHKTGNVRGLLCSFCNKALGMFKDDPQYLRSAITYLEESAR